MKLNKHLKQITWIFKMTKKIEKLECLAFIMINFNIE